MVENNTIKREHQNQSNPYKRALSDNKTNWTDEEGFLNKIKFNELLDSYLTIRSTTTIWLIGMWQIYILQSLLMKLWIKCSLAKVLLTVQPTKKHSTSSALAHSIFNCRWPLSHAICRPSSIARASTWKIVFLATVIEKPHNHLASKSLKTPPTEAFLLLGVIAPFVLSLTHLIFYGDQCKVDTKWLWWGKLMLGWAKLLAHTIPVSTRSRAQLLVIANINKLRFFHSSQQRMEKSNCHTKFSNLQILQFRKFRDNHSLSGTEKTHFESYLPPIIIPFLKMDNHESHEYSTSILNHILDNGAHSSYFVLLAHHLSITYLAIKPRGRLALFGAP